MQRSRRPSSDNSSLCKGVIVIISDDRDEGAISAEFAAAMPVVVFFIVLCLDCVGLMSDKIRAEVCVQRAARAVARHAPVESFQVAGSACTIHTSRHGEWVVVESRIAAAHLVLGRVWPQAQARTRVWSELRQPNDEGKRWNVRPHTNVTE